ncbi:MAG: energy transducer TonB [Opitutus sp.]
MKMIAWLLVGACVAAVVDARALAENLALPDLKEVDIVGTMTAFTLDKAEPTGYRDWDSLVFSIDSPARLKGRKFSILASYYPRPRSTERRKQAEIYWTQRIGKRIKQRVVERVLYLAEEAPCVFGCPNWQLRFMEPNQPRDPSEEYPAELRAAGIEGKARLDFFVASDGSVVDAKVVEADHQLLGKAALKVVSRWVFPPLIPGDERMRNGIRTAVYFLKEEEQNGSLQDSATAVPLADQAAPSRR